jgi:hypothetical protein
VVSVGLDRRTYGGGTRTRTLCNSRCLPKGATPYLLETPVEGLTIAGRFKANRAVRFQDVVLPEFSRSKKIDSFIAYVIDSDSQYDLILGRDFLLKAGIDTCFSTKTTNWLGQCLKMKPPGFWEDPLNL